MKVVIDIEFGSDHQVAVMLPVIKSTLAATAYFFDSKHKQNQMKVTFEKEYETSQ